MDPFFVVGKDVKKNILYVAQEKDNEYRFSSKALITNVNYLLPNIPTTKFECNCKFRYRGKDMKVTVEPCDENSCYLHYDNYEYITKGQIACLYDGDMCLGGGTITKIFDKNGKEILI